MEILRSRCNDQLRPFAPGSGEHCAQANDCPASTPDKPFGDETGDIGHRDLGEDNGRAPFICLCANRRLCPARTPSTTPEDGRAPRTPVCCARFGNDFREMLKRRSGSSRSANSRQGIGNGLAAARRGDSRSKFLSLDESESLACHRAVSKDRWGLRCSPHRDQPDMTILRTWRARLVRTRS